MSSKLAVNCRRGHPLSGENLTTGKSGKYRRCRTCEKMRQQARSKTHPIPLAKISLEDRFWSRVRKSEDGCWEWIGNISTGGYGAIRLSNGRFKTASRLSWELHNGPIPDGLLVCHHCDNPPCVRPDHLFLGTPHDNFEDSMFKGRATCCRIVRD